MKAALFFCVLMLVVLAVLPASAQLILYDDFQTKLIHPDKWIGRGSSDTGVNSLEHGRLILVDPIFGLKWLDIFNRSYAAESSDTGRSSAFNRLQFIDGTGITEIVAAVMVRKVQATTCSTNTAVTSPQARIGGMFFNTGTATPGDQTNDVFAFISVGRPSDSTKASGVLDVSGVVAICSDATCSTNVQIGTVGLGSALLNLPVKLRIAWDQANNRFVFQRGKSPEEYVNYTETVGGPPGTGNGDGSKRIEVYHLIPNCTGIPRPMSFIDAYFDNVKINQIP